MLQKKTVMEEENKNLEQLKDYKLLSLSDVAKTLNLSYSTLWRNINLTKDGNSSTPFPKSIRMACKRQYWLEKDIINWIKSCQEN